MNVLKKFSIYVSVNILGQLAYSLYTMADTFFIAAACGATGLAALNLAFPIFCLINGCGLCLGIGGGSQYAHMRSQGKHQEANQYYTNSLKACIIISILFVFFGLFFSKPLVYFLGADATTFKMTHIYIQVLLLMSPGFLFNTIFQSFIRNDEGPIYAMIAMIAGSIFNIIFDAYFIFGLGWGIFGAIFATCLAPWVSMCVLAVFFLRRKNQFHWDFCKFSTHSIISNGLPFFINECASGILMFILNALFLKSVGNLGVSAFSIITVISLVITAIFNGCTQGIQPLLSFYFGIKDKQNIRSLIRYSLLTILSLSIFLYTILFMFVNPIVSVFNLQQDILLQEMAEQGAKLYFLAIPFVGLNLFSTMALSSLSYYKVSQFISMLRSFFVLIPMAIVLTYSFSYIGTWCSYPCSELFVFGFSILIFFKIRYTSET